MTERTRTQELARRLRAAIEEVERSSTPKPAPRSVRRRARLAFEQRSKPPEQDQEH